MFKKILFLALTLFALSSTALAQVASTTTATNTYHNDKYGFSVTLPAEFVDYQLDAPNWLKAFTNQKVYIQIGYIDPHDNYTAATFDKVPQVELEGFIKRQRLVSALSNSQFILETWGQHKTTHNFPYVWAMFSAQTQLKDLELKTFNLKNYFLQQDKIIQIDCVIPEMYLHESTKIVDAIVQSFAYDQL
ncbi:MAG: hypothetical protein RSE47_03930 [Acidaminococcaceae bacterium]